MSTFQLPFGMRQSFQAALDSVHIFEERNCILYYPGLPQVIDQNITIPLGSDFSSNVWSAGMPLPFNNQQAGINYADGKNLVTVESTGIIQMIIYPNPSKFNNIFPVGERHAAGTIVTRGYVSDIPNILNCVRMQTYMEAGTDQYKYKLDGEPVMPGTLVPTRYFYALWQRI